MIIKMFSLYDSKAECFGPPFFIETTGQAVRALMDYVNNPETMVSRHPEDFVMYEIGEYDNQKGEVINKNPHVLVGMAADFSNRRKNGEVQKTEIKEVV